MNYPGSRWWKFDFHTHTPASLDTTWERNTSGTFGPTDWLLQWMAAEVDCVAITDHNSGGWIDKLKAAYDELVENRLPGFRELTLFPGVELSVNGGFHLLALFDPTRTTSDIDQLLGAVDYAGTRGDCDGATVKSALEVIETVHRLGGISIPAHADVEKGLLRLQPGGTTSAALDANTLRQVFASRLVCAAEVMDSPLAKPQIYSEAGCDWTEVLGSDCHGLEHGPSPGSRFTWIKMSQPSIESLRFALEDGARFSVRRGDEPGQFDPNDLPEHYIESISVQNARYMGRQNAQVLRLSPWFNGVVGGRGTGKSTIVHALRLAYRRSEELTEHAAESEAARVFSAFAQVSADRTQPGALTKSTAIEVEVLRDGQRHRICWHASNANGIVEDWLDEAWVRSENQSFSSQRFPVRIYSQGQIAELAHGNQGALLALIDEVASAQEAGQALAEAKQDYLNARSKMRTLREKLKRSEAPTLSLADVDRKLARFEASENAAVLKNYRFSKRQEAELTSQMTEARRIAEKLETMAASATVPVVSDDAFPQDHADTRSAIIVSKRVEAAVAASIDALRESAERLRAELLGAARELTESEWRRATDATTTNYERVAESLREEGVADPGEYKRLVQERATIREMLAGFNTIAEELALATREASDHLEAARARRRELSFKRNLFLKEALSTNAFVRISLLPYGKSPRTIEVSLRNTLGVGGEKFENDILTTELDGGIVFDLLNDLPSDDSRSREMESRLSALSERFEQAASGEGDFGGHFNNYVQRTCGSAPESLDRLKLYTPADELQVQYSPTGDGKNFRPIDQASAGQQAAAMLAFLLADGKDPIVLDQPEDDLDNQLIYELVVRQIRENKLKRQLIVVTHNPNIVVNGDAEMLHAFNFAAGQCRVATEGSLQDSAVRQEVCRVMEGGEEAFERRYKRLGGPKT